MANDSRKRLGFLAEWPQARDGMSCYKICECARGELKWIGRGKCITEALGSSTAVTTYFDSRCQFGEKNLVKHGIKAA